MSPVTVSEGRALSSAGLLLRCLAAAAGGDGVVRPQLWVKATNLRGKGKAFALQHNIITSTKHGEGKSEEQ